MEGSGSTTSCLRQLPTGKKHRDGAKWNLGTVLSFKQSMEGMKHACPVFNILVVGETGTGKSTLINNLFGRDVMTDFEGHLGCATVQFYKYYSTVLEGVPVSVYDTTGFDDVRNSCDDGHLQALKTILDKGDIHLVIYCMRLSATRIQFSLIRMFQEYSKIGVKWEHAVIAFTFADSSPVPSRVRKSPGFDVACYFNDRVAEWCAGVTAVLVERVGVAPEVAKKVKCYPTTAERDEVLPNGEEWFVPFLLGILEMLSPGATAKLQDYSALADEHHSAKSPQQCAQNLEDHGLPQLVLGCTETMLSNSSTSSTPEAPQGHLQSGAVSQVLQSSTATVCDHEKRRTQSDKLEIQKMGTSGSGTSSEEHATLWRSVRETFSRAQNTCPIFGILVIGETGSGKSTLINTLLGKEVARVGHTMQSETSRVTPHDVGVEGVGLSVYDTPGLDDSRGDDNEAKDLQIMQDLLARGKIHLVIYCFRMTETKMRASLVHALQEYDKIGLPWQHTIMALTFADCVRNFDSQLSEMQEMLKRELRSRFWSKRDVIEKVKSCPTTGCLDVPLPNGTPWFSTFSQTVESILSVYIS